MRLRRAGRRGGPQVVPFPRDDMAHAAAGIGHVTEIARDDMDVDMRNRLAGGGPGVEADVVAVGFGRKLVIQQMLGLLHQRHQCGLFRISRVEPCFHNAAGGHQHMSRRNRKPVKYCERKVVGAKPIFRRNGKEW